mmetsp:Transcript_8995/g.20104  ORF Transcript_8995/g.20104 Transcript_8995/m.20104 type:complete len:85 (+) Transcript_8995:387-641(+)
MFEKTEVNGPDAHPVWRFLKDGKEGFYHDVKWNFAKFLVGRDGQVISRYLPITSPSSIESDILKALDAPWPSAAHSASELKDEV